MLSSYWACEHPALQLSICLQNWLLAICCRQQLLNHYIASLLSPVDTQELQFCSPEESILSFWQHWQTGLITEIIVYICTFAFVVKVASSFVLYEMAWINAVYVCFHSLFISFDCE